MRYNYWTLRYLPDAVRGEFVNVGLIVGRDGADWSMRSIETFDRASRLGGDLATARSWVSSIRANLARTSRDYLALDRVGASEAWVNDMRTFHNNCVQVSDALPVVADSAEEAVALLFDRLVSEPPRTKRSTSHSRAVTRLREAYAQRLPDLSLLNRVRVHSGRQQMDFDFALADGSIQQLSRVWAFDLKDSALQVDRVQAWGFRIEELRDNGGELTASGGQSFEVSHDVPVRVLYVPPSNAEGNESLEVARDAWKRIDAQAMPVSRADELVLA